MAPSSTTPSLPSDYQLPARLLVEGAFSSLWETAGENTLLHIRNRKTIESAEDAARFTTEFIDGLAPMSAHRALIIDVRLARGNNSPEFENQVWPDLAKTVRRFSRLVAVTSTIMGGLQMQRFADKLGLQMRVTTSMRVAIAYSAGDDDVQSGRFHRAKPA